MASWPVREPICVGVKLTVKVQVAPIAIVWPAQVSCSTKSPLIEGVLKLTGASPELVTVIVCEGLCVATACAPKVSVLVESVMAGAVVCTALRSGICQSPRP